MGGREACSRSSQRENRRRRAESKPLELSEELRAEAERSKVLAEEYANEARQANRSKSEFLANMSHELAHPFKRDNRSD